MSTHNICFWSDIKKYIYINQYLLGEENKGPFKTYDQGPVVQNAVSLTSSFRVISLTVLVDLIYNILIFFAEKM